MRRTDKLLAAEAARRSTKVGGGVAHKLSAAAALCGRSTALIGINAAARWYNFSRGQSVLRHRLS